MVPRLSGGVPRRYVTTRIGGTIATLEVVGNPETLRLGRADSLMSP